MLIHVDAIYLVFAKKSKFSFYFILKGELQKAKPYFFIGCFSSDLTYSVCLHLEHGFELYLKLTNETKERSGHLKKVSFKCQSLRTEMTMQTSSTPGQRVMS